MKKSFNIFSACFLLLGILSCGSCSKDGSTTTTISPQGLSCDFNSMTASIQEDYDFNAEFLDFFSQNSRWESYDADITLVTGKGQLTANANNTSQALEAWKLYKTQMPYNTSWEISVDVTMPLYWNTNGGTEAQVGVGLFAGKPVAFGQSSKVYECNLAAINGEERFVQAQLVANRLGEDPIDVQFRGLNQSVETANLKIQFCESNKTLSLFIDNTIVGKGKAINESGLDNWNLSESDVIDVGIMGFAENTTITSNQPSLDNYKIIIY
jgi:hypothetical protein